VRLVTYNDEVYSVDNVFTAAALVHGFDVLLRGQVFAKWERMQRAVQATYDLLSIPAANYRSPIERIFTQGYTGKDGVLPATDLPVGRVINDAGVVSYEGRRYIIAYLSMGEGDLAADDALEAVRQQIERYNRSNAIRETQTDRLHDVPDEWVLATGNGWCSAGLM